MKSPAMLMRDAERHITKAEDALAEFRLLSIAVSAPALDLICKRLIEVKKLRDDLKMAQKDARNALSSVGIRVLDYSPSETGSALSRLIGKVE